LISVCLPGNSRWKDVAVHIGWGQRDGFIPLISTIRLSPGRSKLVLRIGGVDFIADSQQTDDAKAGGIVAMSFAAGPDGLRQEIVNEEIRLRRLAAMQFKRLLDLGRLDVDKHEIAHVLDDQRLAVIRQNEIDRPARKCDLLASRIKD